MVDNKIGGRGGSLVSLERVNPVNDQSKPEVYLEAHELTLIEVTYMMGSSKKPLRTVRIERTRKILEFL